MLSYRIVTYLNILTYRFTFLKFRANLAIDVGYMYEFAVGDTSKRLDLYKTVSTKFRFAIVTNSRCIFVTDLSHLMIHLRTRSKGSFSRPRAVSVQKCLI
jgi:hypothetical protein